MKYIFFGTPDFSARLLAQLIEHGYMPEAVVCNPDRPTGRKKIITAPPTKIVALEKNIPIFQPEKLDAEFRATIHAFDADLFVVFAYNKILRQEVLAIPRLGTVGVHPSLLPEYRGPSPFQTAILDGKTETGVTLYFLDEGIDSGPIIATSEPVMITGKDNFSSLATKLTDAAATLLIKTLPKILAGTILPVTQNESQATYTKKFVTQDGFITPEDLVAAESGDTKKANQVLRKINALNPEPGAWTVRNGKRIKLLEAEMGNGRLAMKTIQEEGGRPKSQA